MIKYLIVLLFLVNLLHGYSQTCRVTGKIVDKKTNEFIPFVHIWSSTTHSGTVSNRDGNFELYHSNLLGTLSLKVTCIGYRTKSIAIQPCTNDLIIYLEQDVVQLKDVVIYSKDYLKEFVTEAIDRIPENYSDSTKKHIGFIREKVASDSLFQSIYYVTEGELEVIKKTYAQKHTEGDVKLMKSRKSLSTAIDSLSLRFYAGAHLPHRFDRVMRREGPLDKDKLDEYEFTASDTLVWNTENLLAIRFEPKGKRGFSGTLWILENTKAIVACEYFLNSGEEFTMEDILKTTERQFIKTKTTYHLSDDKWVLSSIEYLTHFIESKKREIYLNSEYTTTSIESYDGKIPYPERIQFQDILLDATSDSSQNFWSNSGTVIPDSATLSFISKSQTGTLKRNNMEKFLSFLTQMSIRYGYFLTEKELSGAVYRFELPTLAVLDSSSQGQTIIGGFSSGVSIKFLGNGHINMNTMVSNSTRIFSNTQLTLGYQWNVFPKMRPLYIKPHVGTSWELVTQPLQKVASQSDFKVEKTKFNANKIGYGYAQSALSLVGGIELQWEINRRWGLYGAYDIQKNLKLERGLYLQEQNGAFRKQAFIPSHKAESFQKIGSPLNISHFIQIGVRISL